VSYGALAAGVGGALLILGMFLDWGGSGEFAQNGWVFDVVDIVLFVIALLAIGFALLEVTRTSARLPMSSGRTLTTIGIIASTIVLTFLVEADDQKIGLFLSTLASLAILVGGILAERRPELALSTGGGGPRTGAGGAPGAGYGGQPGVGQAPQQQPFAQPPQPQPPPAPAAPAGPAEQATTARAIPQEQPPAAPQQASQPPPPPGGAAGWHQDPYGQKRLRWWDGSVWTEHTAD
jgi:hypothetical protein